MLALLFLLLRARQLLALFSSLLLLRLLALELFYHC
jgi:hypothetical protein